MENGEISVPFLESNKEKNKVKINDKKIKIKKKFLNKRELLFYTLVRYGFYTIISDDLLFSLIP